jgi:hypothetical protein
VTTRTDLVLTVLVWTTCGAYLGGLAGPIALFGAFLSIRAYIGLPLGRRYPELENELRATDTGRFVGVRWARIERDRRFAWRHLDRFSRF